MKLRMNGQKSIEDILSQSRSLDNAKTLRFRLVLCQQTTFLAIYKQLAFPPHTPLQQTDSRGVLIFRFLLSFLLSSFVESFLNAFVSSTLRSSSSSSKTWPIGSSFFEVPSICSAMMLDDKMSFKWCLFVCRSRSSSEEETF